MLQIWSDVYPIPLDNSEEISWIDTSKSEEPGRNTFFSEPENEIKHSKSYNPVEIFLPQLISKPEYDENGNLEDIITYKEQRNNRKSVLCWVETVIITENKICCNKTISKDYSVILDSTSKRSSEDDNKYSDDYDFWGTDEYSETEDLFQNDVRNFTRTTQTDAAIITEYKKLICGSGAVVTKQYYDWPNSKRQRVEIKVGSEVPTDENLQSVNSYNPTTESRTTYDTVQTPPTLMFPIQDKNNLNNREQPFIANILFPNVGEPTKVLKHERPPFITDVPPLGNRFPAKIPESAVNIFPTDPKKKLYQKAFLLKRNISYQNSNDSQTLRNPFDNTALTNRLKHIKKPILLHVLFPNENLFNNLTQSEEEKSFEVTVKLQITIDDMDQDDSNKKKNGVTLQLVETSLIVISYSAPQN